MTKDERTTLEKRLRIYKERKSIIDEKIKEIKKLLKKEEEK